ncbi:tetratricopeptide repeat protein [Leifsonia shinshuensis]|uniref:tetratricopeptide repeat protein n=1 Tax=Leifsonia shinshuensis TaxID=150026 RepID=UPI00285CCEB4|nr:tetratricopeptide repeat protein [Leifsonia shinshuensis]MDR6970345.1 tetratricopeptide (TPR) repeat protein [Leifsonia shinshuensis]
MDDWRRRVDAVWAAADDAGEDATLAAIDALVAERPASDPEALFESASARDFAGLQADAEPFYRAALAHGLAEPYRGQAIVQLASTLRNLDRSPEALALLRDFLAAEPDHPLADAARAFAALALFDDGMAADALREALEALVPHLPRYGRAVTAYAAALDDD